MRRNNLSKNKSRAREPFRDMYLWFILPSTFSGCGRDQTETDPRYKTIMQE